MKTTTFRNTFKGARILKKLMIIALAALITLVLPGITAAETTGIASVNVSSDGVLSVSIDDATFTDVHYSFEDESTTAMVAINVEDNRGNGDGWYVTLHGSDFKRGDNTSFDINNLALTSAEVTSTAGQSATDIITSSVIVADDTTGEVIASAPERAGMGHYTIEYSATLVVPGGTLTGEYSSTLTVGITSGP